LIHMAVKAASLYHRSAANMFDAGSETYRATILDHGRPAGEGQENEKIRANKTDDQSEQG